MSIPEKYPENIPGDLNVDQHIYKSIQWILAKAGIVYTFTRSRIDSNYVYIQKNDETKPDGLLMLEIIINIAVCFQDSIAIICYYSYNKEEKPK